MAAATSGSTWRVLSLRPLFGPMAQHHTCQPDSRHHPGRLSIRRILARGDSPEWSSYTDVYRDYTKTSQSLQYLRNKRTIIGAIEQFAVYGRFPNGRRRHELFARGAYAVLTHEFRSIIDIYRVVAQHEGKKLTTIAVEAHSAATFFLSLQRQGITNLTHITEEAVLAIFLAPNDTLRWSGSYKKNVAAVLTAGLRDRGDMGLRIRAFLPALRETVLRLPIVKKSRRCLRYEGRIVYAAILQAWDCCRCRGLSTTNPHALQRHFW